MIRPTAMILAAAISLAATLSGCDTDAPLGQPRVGASSQPLAATRDEVFAAANREVAKRFSLATSDAATGKIVSQPQYLDRTSNVRTGELRIISSPSDLRRVAKVRVHSEEGVVRADVTVLVERRDTTKHQNYESFRNGGELTGLTPIDSGANLEPERREVWTQVNRDFDLERQILDGIATAVKK